MISYEVMDAIAHIELHRQEMEKEASAAAACNEALRKLHELLNREREALQAHGPDAGRAANVEALTAEIGRVKRLASAAAGRGMPKRGGGPQRQGAPRPSDSHNRPRTRGRRTMGRGGGRGR